VSFVVTRKPSKAFAMAWIAQRLAENRCTTKEELEAQLVMLRAAMIKPFAVCVQKKKYV
jgi:hypothetical protein